MYSWDLKNPDEVRHVLSPAQERGFTKLGWLNSRHGFSYGHYGDPEFMGFGTLRAINEDRGEPRTVSDAHGHRGMEIISYVTEDAHEHRDSLGNDSKILPGEVQIMTAGTGIRQSEFNPSNDIARAFSAKLNRSGTKWS